MNRSMDVVAFATPCMDLLFEVDHQFLIDLEGETGGCTDIDIDQLADLLHRVGKEPKVIPGGSGANTLKGLARLGSKASAIGKLGGDHLAEQFLKDFAPLDIHDNYIRTQIPTAQIVIFICPDGERTMRAFTGTQSAFTPTDLDRRHFTEAKIAHVEGYSLYNKGLAEAMLKMAHEEGCLTSFNLASFEIVRRNRDLVLKLIHFYTDFLICNADEARELTKLPPDEACHELALHCGKAAVVTEGKRGCWVCAKGDVPHQVKTVPVKQVDSTGAGDLFSAGFLHGYLRGERLERCCEIGSLLGGEVVQVVGPMLNEERWERVLAHIEQL